MLIDELIEFAVNKAPAGIRDVRAGLSYTAVLLEDGACGVAYTFRNELGQCCGILDEAGGLIGTDAAKVIPWAKSDNRLKAAIGVAALNAVLNVPHTDWETGNVTGAMNIRPDDTFGMIGAFRPILSEIKSRTKNVYVFEQNVAEGSGLYPSETIPQHLPKCDVVMITATSIINQTIDGVVAHCKNAREVCLVGPSTPMCPEVLGQYHITLLAGSVVTNADMALQVVSQGGGTMSLKPAVRQVLARAGQG